MKLVKRNKIADAVPARGKHSPGVMSAATTKAHEKRRMQPDGTLAPLKLAQVAARITPAELVALRTLAGRQQLTASAYVREMILERLRTQKDTP